MSVEGLRAEAQRWLRQAQDDKEAAEALVSVRKYAQAAFLAQQAGEKALKGLWLSQDLDAWGHSLARLIKDLPPSPIQQAVAPLLDAALALDKLYIPTRYPDALPGTIPAESYTRAEAEAALQHAQLILQAVIRLIPAK